MGSISICVLFIWSLNLYTYIIGLFLGQLSELRTKRVEVKSGDLLVKLLGQDIDLVLILSGAFLLPKLDLSEDLVAEGVGHHKGWVAGGATEVEESALSEHQDAV